MINIKILRRVLKVKYNNSIGTSFTIEHNEKQYLISAKHIFQGMTKKDSIEIMQDSVWKKIIVDPIFCDNQVDIIIFPLEENITPVDNLTFNGNIIISQEAFFLGFPYGLQMDSENINNKFPFPFVKKCIVSAIDYKNKPKTIFLDGHNNKGFSGGPVVLVNEKNEIQVIGVVSSYIYDQDPQKMKKEICENSGIFTAHAIKHVFDELNNI